jgi:signal transduction histidine kinase
MCPFMPPSAWFRAPHRLVTLFLLVTLVPSLLLLAFGWRIVQQDRELERRQADLLREQAADVIVATLEQAVAATEQALRSESASGSIATTEDSVVLAITPSTVVTVPAGRLLFLPRAAPGQEAPAGAFTEGEDLEHRRGDAAAATAWFAARTRSTDGALRAGALIRMARNLRKAGHPDLALDAYSQARALRGTSVSGTPTDLLARWAACTVLEEAGRSAQLAEEARELRALLLARRWPIERAAFDMYFADASRWYGVAAPSPDKTLSLAAELFWRDVPTGAEPASGRRSLTVDGHQFTVLWHRAPGGLRALLAGQRFAERHWLSRVTALEARHQARVTLRDPVAPRLDDGTARRSSADSGLPWTVTVATDAAALTARAGERQTIWLVALAILAVLVTAGTYATVRAVSRELAVARLQSDFVAAVSHEFRTPLTSLRQLTEMLIDRPDSPPEKRESYYKALARQTERLHRLVESLLDFGRMEAGTSPYRRTPSAAAPLLAEIVDQFASDDAARGHAVRLRIASAGTIAVDRDVLNNALWNLLDNAAKYSPAGSTIDVDVSTDGSQLAVAVRDRGFGIPAAEHAEIFRKFVRGERARAERIPGTGIGLAMVQHIVVAHGGTVTVESAAEEGSTFTIRLPLLTEAMPREQEEAGCLGS